MHYIPRGASGRRSFSQRAKIFHYRFSSLTCPNNLILGYTHRIYLYHCTKNFRSSHKANTHSAELYPILLCAKMLYVQSDCKDDDGKTRIPRVRRARLFCTKHHRQLMFYYLLRRHYVGIYSELMLRIEKRRIFELCAVQEFKPN